MLNAKPSDRALPTFITLLVIGVLLMTFDVRLAGGGVVGVLRTGTQEIVSPLQRVAALVVTPIANALDSLSNVASLREQNAALKAELAEAIAQDVIRVLGSREASVSVSFEEVPSEEWAEKVYGPDIAAKPGNLYKKPGYTV